MKKYIAAAALIAIAWIMVLLLGQSPAIAAYATAFILFALGAWLAYQRLWARRGARRLEKGMDQLADKHAQGVRPDVNAKMKSMRESFNSGLASLKAANRRGGGGAAALYTLPWYMIIGPSGAGKTTAIETSGLRFPSAKKLKGTGGTRNCDWWLSREAVILDTAGRYVGQDDDQAEWLEFLELLRKSRPKKPLNGILIAISVEDIAGAREDDILAHCEDLRKRVEEVTDRLQMIFPIYLLLTKCDRLAGFVETFSDLNRHDKGQAWGFTIGTEELTSTAPGKLFEERFDELHGTLERKVIYRLSRENRLEPRERIFEFPKHFASLRDNLKIFVDALFADVYQEVPVLRGVYFTSGTQVGRPFDRLKHGIKKALKIETREPPEPEVTKKEGYFLRDVFFKVIFPDQNIAVRTRQETKRQALRWASLVGGSVALAVLLGSIPIYTGSKQRELVHGVREMVEQIRDRKDPKKFPFTEIAELRRRMPGLCGVEGDGHAWMAADTELAKRACELYTRLFHAHVLEPLARKVQKEMTDAVTEFEKRENQRGLTGDEYEQLCRALKVHLLLTNGGAAAGEPVLETAGEETKTWVRDRLIEKWQTKKDDPNAPEKKANIEFYLSILTSKTRPPINLREDRLQDLVDNVRKALSQTSVERRLLDQIIEDVENEYHQRDLDLDAIIGGKQAPFSTATRVRRVFTREGWEKHVRRRLVSSLEDCEPWVLGNSAEGASDPKKVLQEVRKLYFDDYAKEWRHFIIQIDFNKPGTDEARLRMIDDLIAGPVTPLHQLMKTVAFNAELELPPPEKTAADQLADQAGEKLKTKAKKKFKQKTGLDAPAEEEDEAPKKEFVKSVRDDLLPFAEFGVTVEETSPSGDKPPRPPLDSYVDELSKLRTSFESQVIRKPEEAADFVRAAKDAEDRVKRLLDKASVWKPQLTRMLIPPVEALEEAGTQARTAGSENRWCTAVAEPFSKMESDFPFNPAAHDDAPLRNFGKFFNPKTGELWSYYSTNLAGDIEQSGARFRFRGEARKSYDPKIPEFLARAHELGGLLFSGDVPKVRFQVLLQRVPNVEYVELEVGGQKIKHTGGPDLQKTIEWPPPGDVAGAKISVRGQDAKGRPRNWEAKEPKGDWAFFRLLGRGTVSRVSAREVQVSWPMESFNNEPITIMLSFDAESPIYGSGKQFLHPFIALAKSFPKNGKGTQCKK